MKVAIFSPMPPERSGIADYSALLLPGAAGALRGRRRQARREEAAPRHRRSASTTSATTRTPTAGSSRRCGARPASSCCTTSSSTTSSPASRSAAATGTATSTRWSARAASSGGCSATPCSTSASRRCGRTGPQDFHLAGEVLGLATGLIVHSHYVHDRARAAGYDGPIWVVPHPAFPVPDGARRRGRRRSALRHVRQRQLEQAGAAAARGVRPRPAGARRRHGCCSSVPPRPASTSTGGCSGSASTAAASCARASSTRAGSGG